MNKHVGILIFAFIIFTIYLYPTYVYADTTFHTIPPSRNLDTYTVTTTYYETPTTIIETWYVTITNYSCLSSTSKNNYIYSYYTMTAFHTVFRTIKYISTTYIYSITVISAESRNVISSIDSTNIIYTISNELVLSFISTKSSTILPHTSGYGFMVVFYPGTVNITTGLAMQTHYETTIKTLVKITVHKTYHVPVLENTTWSNETETGYILSNTIHITATTKIGNYDIVMITVIDNNEQTATTRNVGGSMSITGFRYYTTTASIVTGGVYVEINKVIDITNPQGAQISTIGNTTFYKVTTTLTLTHSYGIANETLATERFIEIVTLVYTGRYVGTHSVQEVIAPGTTVIVRASNTTTYTTIIVKTVTKTVTTMNSNKPTKTVYQAILTVSPIRIMVIDTETKTVVNTITFTINGFIKEATQYRTATIVAPIEEIHSTENELPHMFSIRITTDVPTEVKTVTARVLGTSYLLVTAAIFTAMLYGALRIALGDTKWKRRTLYMIIGFIVITLLPMALDWITKI